MEQRVSFVTLAVTDLDAARRFYVEALGWRAALDVPGEVLMFEAGERLVLSLWAREAFEAEVGPLGPPGPATITLAHNVTTPAEVDAVLTDAARAGAEVRPAERRDWGGYSGYFTDPEGYRWEVAWNPHPIGQFVLPEVDPG